jgi:predicted RNA-binding protein YlqC (UPF0109 family)
MKGLLEYLVTQLVDHPEEVEVKEIETNREDGPLSCAWLPRTPAR